MAGDDDGDPIWITSTRDSGGTPACELSWGDAAWYAPVDDVRATATDLVTCAAYAEMMMHLTLTLSLPAGTISAFMSELLSKTGRTMFGTRSTLSLLPAGSTKRREALVLISREVAGDERGRPPRGRRRKRDGMISPARARGMAAGWFAAAEATESDQLFTSVLPATCNATPGQVEATFARLRELRAGLTGES